MDLKPRSNNLNTLRLQQLQNVLLGTHADHGAGQTSILEHCQGGNAHYAKPGSQFRLLIHTAAYWLVHTLRGLAPKASFWRDAQFDTLRLGLIKVAARVIEMKTRIKLSLPTSFPYQESLAMLAARTVKLPP